MPLTREVGLLIRALRRRRGLTQARLAEMIGRSEVALRSIERGASAPSFETLERLVQALEVPPAGFFPVVRSGSNVQTGEPERRARKIAAVTAQARTFNDADLALAEALIAAVAAAERGRHGPER
ncbi:helix-turn-helix domain-containing protein [Pelagibius sp.]|uniref:helix-turn-helix domain-containing protein n=1 Tax=Pelagibius sp. TaxID=1931238 RepID=UPI003B51103E